MAPVIRSSTLVTINAKKSVISAENGTSLGKTFLNGKKELLPTKNGTTRRPVLSDLTSRVANGKPTRAENIGKPVKGAVNGVATLSKTLKTIDERAKVTTNVKKPVGSLKPSVLARTVYPKRKAEHSPPKNGAIKRTAFCVKNTKPAIAKTTTVSTAARVLRSRTSKSISEEIVKLEIKEENKTETGKLPFPVRRSLRQREKSENSSLKVEEVPAQTVESKAPAKEEPKEAETETKLRRSVRNLVPKRSSTELQKSAEEKKSTRKSSTRYSLSRKSLSADKTGENGSLYISALEDLTLSSGKGQLKNEKESRFAELSEFDKELLHDPHQVSLYAMEIFEYLKSREANFRISSYMHLQPDINEKMRATLVDWMVEVQENFELNHETLYLAVKLVDLYLQKVKVHRESLQLVGAAALFLSCKYDERLSPLIEDFVYVGDNAYDQDGLLTMEQSILKHINFELSVPISYSFLRRYARCARIQMPLLTLARYILELGLMDYSTVTLSDSKQAAAALYLAFRMVDYSDWTKALEYYTGYKLSDFKDIVLILNKVLHQKPVENEQTIRNKYSHKLFFKVAETPLLRNDQLNLEV